MSTLVTVYWRDIPSQVLVRQGRRTVARRMLSERFQKAIDRAAMRAGKGGSAPYLEAWRRVATPLPDGDPEAAVRAAARCLEAELDGCRLERLVKAGGVAAAVQEA